MWGPPEQKPHLRGLQSDPAGWNLRWARMSDHPADTGLVSRLYAYDTSLLTGSWVNTAQGWNVAVILRYSHQTNSLSLQVGNTYDEGLFTVKSTLPVTWTGALAGHWIGSALVAEDAGNVPASAGTFLMAADRRKFANQRCGCLPIVEQLAARRTAVRHSRRKRPTMNAQLPTSNRTQVLGGTPATARHAGRVRYPDNKCPTFNDQTTNKTP